MFDLFIKTAAESSRNVTQTYSTSFSLGIKTLHKRFHAPIYGIYGMVRYADEIHFMTSTKNTCSKNLKKIHLTLLKKK
jgi:phytoene/squalene synthetase